MVHVGHRSLVEWPYKFELHSGELVIYDLSEEVTPTVELVRIPHDVFEDYINQLINNNIIEVDR